MTWNPKREAEIRKRCEAATEGPWKESIFSPELDPVEMFRENLSYGKGVIHSVHAPKHPESRPPDHYKTTAITGNGPNSENNRAFIAHSRTDLPDALAEIYRLRKRVREVEAETWEKAAKLVPVAYDWLAHDFENKAQAARREP